MELLEIIREYIEVLIWPLIILLFHNPIIKIINKISKINISGVAEIEIKQKVIEVDNELIRSSTKEDVKIDEVKISKINKYLKNNNLNPVQSKFNMEYYLKLLDKDYYEAIRQFKIEIYRMIDNIIIIEKGERAIKKLDEMLEGVGEKRVFSKDQVRIIKDAFKIISELSTDKTNVKYLKLLINSFQGIINIYYLYLFKNT